MENMNCPLIGNKPGLIAYYDFNEGVPNSNNAGITTLNDGTSHGLNGSLQSFSLSGITSNWINGANPVSGSNCVLTYYFDADSDGYGNPLIDSAATSPPMGYALVNTDCNDTNAIINPGATEICGNGIDEDCNGIDSAFAEPLCILMELMTT